MEVLQSRSISGLQNQWHHWMQAASRLSRLENLASTYAWEGIDRELRKTIEQSLTASINRLIEEGKQIDIQIKAGADYHRIRKSLLKFRQKYLTTETTVHFFTDALNSRTSASVAALLRACDVLCKRSMESILPQLGKEVPPCFTFLDKGIGAAILKQGIFLWDGSLSAVAAVKITFHNLMRPTAAIHETGHQVAHILKWNEELAAGLRKGLEKYNSVIANAFSSWSSEIAADNFAFVHTGYAAVASLHNVVAGTADSVFAFHQGDPHPISYLRVLFNIECCRKFYGKGPWDVLEANFREDYAIDKYNSPSTSFIKACEKVLGPAVEICLATKYNSFGGKSLADIINPEHVSPKSLEAFEKNSEALQQSHAWVTKECLRMLALSGLRIAIDDNEEYKRQEEWMRQLGMNLINN